MGVTPPTFDDIEAAADRIKDRVRRTPCLRTRFVRNPIHNGDVLLKLECLQVTGSFKSRGANNATLSLDDAAVARGVVTASSGNHGSAVAYAARASGTKAYVYLPDSTPADKIAKLHQWDAEVIIGGAVWDDANDAALARAERDGLNYIAPFADPTVIAGNGTVGREMMKQSSNIDILVVAIGGGGLISGVATAAKAMKPSIKIIGVEPTGAPTLKSSRDAGALVTLDEITTAATSLAPRRSADINLDIITKYVDDIVLVSDDDMRAATHWLWFEMGIAAELSGAAALAAIHTGKISLPRDATVAAVVCGAGATDIV